MLYVLGAISLCVGSVSIALVASSVRATLHVAAAWPGSVEHAQVDIRHFDIWRWHGKKV